jgi:capsular polysaccharide biosynthesis protein
MRARWTSPLTMSDVDARLPPHLRRRRAPRTVVVIADHRTQVERLEIPHSAWSDSRVVTLVGRSVGQMHDDLAALSEIGLVIDVRTSWGPAQLEAFRTGFFHLGPRDVWVALRQPGPAEGGEPLVRLARTLRKPDAQREVDRPWRPVARAVARVRKTPKLVLVVKKQRHLLLLREDALPLLQTREPDLTVSRIAQLDAGVLDVRPRPLEYGVRGPVLRVPDVLPYPVHTVRRYEGLLHLPKDSLAHHRRTALPDSFRWHLNPRLHSIGLRHVDEHFGRLRERPSGETLEGAYYLFLYNNPGHFGHLMTEALSKLWGWDAAKAADPSLKILCRLHPVREETPETRPEATLFPAFGIPPDDIVWVDAPVSVTSLVGCTPMWHNAPPFYVHPRIVDTWGRIRAGLIGDEPLTEAPRIFVTRRDLLNRPCTNVEAVEAIFAAHGFAVVSPEDLTIPEQAATFAAARVVAGFGGAGMFNLVYAHALDTVIVLNQWAYEARNEHLFAAAHGARLHTFWSAPDVDHPPGRSTYTAHQSGWAFDMAHLEQPLNALLESLPD